MLADALRVAADVGPIVPLAPRTHRPLVAFDRASTDPETIADWYDREPLAGIGVAAWLARLVALDLESPAKGGANGFATFAELLRVIGPLPPTRKHRTKSGGVHLIYSLPPGVTLRSSQSLIRGRDLAAPGLDVVAGRAVLRWPGTKGYTRANDREVATLPATWIAALSDPPARDHERAHVEVGEGRERRYALAGLEAEALAVADLAAGRNVALTRSAFRLGRLSPPLLVSEILDALRHACAVNGALKEHGERRCVDTIMRAVRAGSAKPRLAPAEVRP